MPPENENVLFGLKLHVMEKQWPPAKGTGGCLPQSPGRTPCLPGQPHGSDVNLPDCLMRSYLHYLHLINKEEMEGRKR